MTHDNLKIKLQSATKMNQVNEIHQQLKEIFKDFEFNNKKDCVQILVDEEVTWNTMIDNKTTLNFYIVHKTLMTSNVLLMDYEWYHWEMPTPSNRFTRTEVSTFKSLFPGWKDAKYFIFSKAIKRFIAQRWDLVERTDFYFDLGFMIFKPIFNNFNLRLIPAFNYLHFEQFTSQNKINYQGIFYRLRSRDFYTRFPHIELENINLKNQLTNHKYIPTLRLIKYLYSEMMLHYETELEKDTNVHLAPNQYHIFDYLLFSINHKYFLKDTLLERVYDVLTNVIQKMPIKPESFLLPNNMISFTEIEIDQEDLQYTLECLLAYISELLGYDDYYEISEDVKNFVDYMESLEEENFKKH